MVDHSINDRLVNRSWRIPGARAQLYLGRMRDQRSAVILAFLMLLASACRKDKDESPPRITILQPSEGYVLSIPDTMVVSVEVSDDMTVESVQFILADVNGVPITSPVTVAVNSPSATVVRDLIVLDERIPSGSYTLTVRASDGSNERKVFRSINVLAAPLRLRALFIAPPPGSSPATITRIDSAGNQSLLTVMNDIHGAAVDGYSQHVFLAGGLTAPVIASPTAASAFGWQIPNLNAMGLPYFNGPRMDPADGRLYYSTNDGFIRGFTGEGAQTFTASAMAGYASELTSIVGDRVISIQRNLVQDDLELVALALLSGQQLAQFPLDLDTVLAMDARTDQNLLLFGNRDGKGYILDRNAYQGAEFELRVFNEGPIRDVVRSDQNTWFMAVEGVVVRYHYPSNTVIPLASIPEVRALAKDEATGVLYAGSGAEIQILDPTTGNINGTITCPTEVGYILPLLNR